MRALYSKGEPVARISVGPRVRVLRNRRWCGRLGRRDAVYKVICSEALAGVGWKIVLCSLFLTSCSISKQWEKQSASRVAKLHLRRIAPCRATTRIEPGRGPRTCARDTGQPLGGLRQYYTTTSHYIHLQSISRFKIIDKITCAGRSREASSSGLIRPHLDRTGAT